MDHYQKDYETRLAYELADALEDREALSLYMTFTQRYPEQLLRKVLKKVLEIPEEQIRKTRGALFNYLIQKHAQAEKYHPRP